MKPKKQLTAAEFLTVTDEEIKALYTAETTDDVTVHNIDVEKAIEYAQKAYVGKTKALSTVQGLKDQLEEKNGTIQEITDAQRKALEDAGEYQTLYKTEVAARATDKDAFETRISGVVGNTKKRSTTTALNDVVSELFTDDAAELIAPFVRSRLSVEYDEATDKVTLVPLDPAGNPSGEDMTQFKASLRANEKYASFLKGDGNTGGGGGGGAGPGAGGSIPKEWAAAYSVDEPNFTVQSEVLKKNPAMHKKLTEEMNKTAMANVAKNRIRHNY